MKSAILLLLIALPVTAHAAVELKAGVARVEITPSTFMPMYGYANRKCGPANGTHDPLTAKVLVLEAGDSRMALVTTDLGSLVSDNRRRDRRIFPASVRRFDDSRFGAQRFELRGFEIQDE